MTGIEALARRFETRAPGASQEAFAVFLTLGAKRTASPATLAKTLDLPHAAVLRALAEIEAARLAILSAPKGAAGRRTARLTDAGEALVAEFSPPSDDRKRSHKDR